MKAYLARGHDGLETGLGQSIHTEVLRLCGLTVMGDARQDNRLGRISHEQLLAWEPDILFAQDEAFFQLARRQAPWNRLKAVREGRLYRVPAWPFGWLDGPPGINRLAGLIWLSALLDGPAAVPGMIRDLRAFHASFYGMAAATLLGAGISLIKILAEPYSQLPSMTFWLLGGLSAVRSHETLPVALMVLCSLLPVWLLRWRINVLALQDDEARSLGMPVSALRLGIESLARSRLDRISGGERQLALIARALAQRSRFLIMDEPASSLDFANQVRVLEQVAHLRGEGLGVLMCTHQPEHAARAADWVVLYRDGGILAQGDPRAMLSRGRLRQLYQLPERAFELPDWYGQASQNA